MLTREQIDFLDKICIGTWKEINGIINVDGNINMSNMNMTQIPVSFGQINGYFDCSNNLLTTLKGCPNIIGQHFVCNNNQLTTLKNGPKKIYTYYNCNHNQLTNLVGALDTCYANFYCFDNLLTTLEGCPSVIRCKLLCNNNIKLRILYGIGRVNNKIIYHNINELNEWIIEKARCNIQVTYENIAQWIKQNNKFNYLYNAPEKLRLHFSKFILNNVDFGIYY